LELFAMIWGVWGGTKMKQTTNDCSDIYMAGTCVSLLKYSEVCVLSIRRKNFPGTSNQGRSTSSVDEIWPSTQKICLSLLRPIIRTCRNWV
jgi:hypothetical protein